MSKFTPEFKGPIEGWIVNHMTQHYWKVQATMTRMDVMQEAYYIFLRLSKKYAETVTEPEHFMALFKTAWSRHYIDLAKKDSSCRTEVEHTPATADAVGEVENEGYLRTLVRQAPSDVRLVLTLFLNAPAELLELATSSFKRVGRGGARAADNQRVAALLGLPADSRPLDAVESYLIDVE